MFSDTRNQIPVLDPNLAPSAFYNDAGRGASKEARPFEVSDSRFPYVTSGVVNQTSQPSAAATGSAISHGGQPIFTTYKDMSDAYTLPGNLDTAPTSSSKAKDTPSSIQAISVGLMSAPTTFSTPRSGSGQSGLPGVMSLDYSAENALSGGPEATRTVSYVIYTSIPASSALHSAGTRYRLPILASMTASIHNGSSKTICIDVDFHMLLQ